MNEKEIAYVESLVNELTDALDGCYQNILDGKDFELPNFEKIIKNRKVSDEQAEFITNVFSQPLAELYEVDAGENEKLNKQYEWLVEDKRKKLISVMDSLVTACVSEYTEMQPEFQELKEKFRKIAENEKEETPEKE
jgi:dGTP triphosphohydrolase